MSVTATVRNYLQLSGDQEQDLVFDSDALSNSPAIQNVVTLAVGNNSLSVPDVEGFTTHGLIIVPPSQSDVEITLKGVNGDTGISLSSVQASVIQFGTPPAAIVLNVAEELIGVRLIWF